MHRRNSGNLRCKLHLDLKFRRFYDSDYGSSNDKQKRSRTVRKTLTIDGDLAIEIQKFMVEKGADEKTVINELLRLGLISEQSRQTKAARFGLPSFNKGIGEISRAGLNKMLDEV